MNLAKVFFVLKVPCSDNKNQQYHTKKEMYRLLSR